MLSTRDEVVRYIEEYIRENQIPIRYGVRVLAVKTNRGLYMVETIARHIHRQEHCCGHRYFGCMAEV